MKTIEVKYYAALREARGLSTEKLDVNFGTAKELYEYLHEQHSFKLQESQLKVAINGKYQNFNSTLQSGDSVVFIPPVAGG